MRFLPEDLSLLISDVSYKKNNLSEFRELEA